MSESIPEAFTGKLGPLPVWAWGAIIGVGIVGYVWWTGKTDSTDAEAGTDTPPPTSTDIGDAIDGAFLTTPANGGRGGDDNVPDSVDTNSAWAFRAIAALIGKGVSPLTAQGAINTYLDEEPLTPEQAKLVNEAIGLIGQPPESVGTPKTTPPPTALKVLRYYRVSSGQIISVLSDGTEKPVTDEQYIALGMPVLTSDALPWKYHTAAGNTTTLANIAAKYGTTVNRLIVLNRYKTGVQIKKGTKVKVPSK